MPTFKRDGVDLYYELEGQGPPVVLISGFSNNGADLGYTYLRHLLADRYTVLVVDNRGSGRTITDSGANATIEDMADDIVAILDHHRLGSIHTLGHSMGGMIAMTLALRHPEKVCSQVIAASSACPPANRTMYYLETMRSMLDANLPREIINRFAMIGIFDEGVFQDRAFSDAFVQSPPYPYEQTHAGYEVQLAAVKTYDLRTELPSTTTPTLVLGSPGDLLAPPHLVDEIATLIPGAESKCYPGGHMFFGLPTNFDQFMTDVTAFWDKHS